LRQEKELELPGGSLYYVMEEDGVHITRTGRLIGEITVPKSVNGQLVVAVEKKAFLSQKKLRSLVLPAGIKEIGEWAFAYCSSLQSVSLAKRKTGFGKGVFLECRNLEKIALCPIEKGTVEEQEQIAALLAAAPVLLDAEYLLELLEAGSTEWLMKWDARMLDLLHQEDLEGYTKMILCGEEDLDLDPDTFQKEKRKSKVRLCFKRLMNPVGISKEVRTELTDYVLAHKKGCETEEAWEVIFKEHGDDRAYFSFFLQLGGMTADNKGAMLADMGENHAEMKAFLLKYGQEVVQEDFFAGLEL